jgi:MFS family permease
MKRRQAISKRNIILIFACTAVFFEALDIAIINLAIPLIQADFALTSESVHWAQTLYILIYGGFLIVGGKLSDLYGRKRMFMAGSLLFLVTSLGAGLSFHFYSLVSFRALQGLAAALLMPAALSIITNTFTEHKERSQAIGIFSAFAAIGSGCGLSLGGLLATAFGWQWIFFINVPVIAVTLWVGKIFIDKDESLQSKETLDIVSGGTAVLVILAISYFVHILPELQSNKILFSVLLTFILAGVSFFIQRSKKQKYPLLQFSLLEGKTSRIAIAVSFLLGAFFTGYLFIISLIFQSEMRYSAAATGFFLLPFSILSALAGKFLMPLLMKKFTLIQSSLLGMILMTMGGALLLLGSVFNYPLLLILLSVACVTGFGIAITFTSLMVLSVQSVPDEQHGLITGLVSTVNFLGGGLGLSLLAVFMHSDGESLNPLSLLVLTFYALAGVCTLLGVIRSYARAESSFKIVRN